eukprot:5676375-Heterocapsa_arctica.AAC.1
MGLEGPRGSGTAAEGAAPGRELYLRRGRGGADAGHGVQSAGSLADVPQPVWDPSLAPPASSASQTDSPTL